ncbi:DUF3168 domain-containing protein [Streptomyces sp. DSM 44915]|uniref:DUF3168 domain-containing protein n=1 Tax=Streptomyces chisholmiae TaxID=3075540 RepID=A0ABU2JZ23_9ACTN|nr:DUF3168 domain-containing protein [Streptomyces sp. DSM 44915]MDT0270255.1 DUF3168 domain-containing protein [Streptomyces sp. DSM 44915]
MTTPTTPAPAIQRAIYARLTGDTALMVLASGGVYDFVPEPAPHPYIVIGEAIETPDNTHGGFGRQTVVTLHVWTRARGHAPGLAIATRVVGLLDHQPLAIEGHDHIATNYEFMQTLVDPAPGDIRHVVLRLRVRTDQPRS